MIKFFLYIFITLLVYEIINVFVLYFQLKKLKQNKVKLSDDQSHLLIHLVLFIFSVIYIITYFTGGFN